MNNPAPKFAAPLGWKVEDSAQLYQVDSWGSGYFGVNEAGHVVVGPGPPGGRRKHDGLVSSAVMMLRSVSQPGRLAAIGLC